jgi:hypothetical protein
MRSLLVVVAAFSMLVAASCRRPLGQHGKDAGDAGVTINSDGALADVPRADGAADAPNTDAPHADIAVDLTGEAAIDAGRDVNLAAVCPAGVPPLDVCGCGCCGEAMGRACYYPAHGESRDDIPNPVPPPQNCAMAGCSFGVRHVCCAGPGTPPGVLTVCANNTSDEDYPRFQVTTRDGLLCTTLELAIGGGNLPIMGPGPYSKAMAWRARCDSTADAVRAIGGLGTVTTSPLRHRDGASRFDIHVALFFDSGTGIADAVRIDVDDLAVGAHCDSGGCPACGGTCAFDTTYHYGYDGGRVRFRDYVLLAPPVSFTHVRTPTTTMPADQSCAPPLPFCGDAALDAGDAMAVLKDADVQDAFRRSRESATTPFYGTDPRVFDGQVFEITRDSDGAGLLIGGQCPPDATTSSCMPIPGGLSRLVTVLTALDEQQLAEPTCATLRP